MMNYVISLKHTEKYIVLLLASTSLLSGCLGGTVAQQIARSIATSVADNAVASAMDVQEVDAQDKFSRKPKNIVLKDTPPDPYLVAFASARFEELKPISEPLPDTLTEVETIAPVVISSQLVRVELFNLLIGDEKAAVYTKAQLLGATLLPKPREWKLWQVATGKIKTEANHSKTNQSEAALKQNQELITFLIPPEFGKLPSGSVTLVEIANAGELNIARYKVN